MRRLGYRWKGTKASIASCARVVVGFFSEKDALEVFVVTRDGLLFRNGIEWNQTHVRVIYSTPRAVL